ncbi:MAG: cell division protein SepF [Clostridiales bacterium]|nr:cell division protein SepF [Clostridiales bacterium]
MAQERKNKFLEFFGFGNADEYEDDEEYFYDDEEIDEPQSRSVYDDDKPRRSIRKPKVVPMQDKRPIKSSVVIYSPKSYNDAQPLVMQLIQHKHVIIKLDKVERRVAQRILDFMSGAAYASDAQVTEVSKGSIYLFASNQTYIDKSDDVVAEQGDDGFTLDDEF